MGCQGYNPYKWRYNPTHKSQVLSYTCQAAIARSGRDDIVLPLMVAASVGGAERGDGGTVGGNGGKVK